MHVFTVVIAPGDIGSAATTAHELLAIAASRHGADYWTVGYARLAERFEETGFPHAAVSGILPIADLPSPLPARLTPAALVTPDGNWSWRPLEGEGLERWPARVERTLARHRNGHCYVGADVHF